MLTSQRHKLNTMDNKKLTEHGIKWGIILGLVVSLIRITPWFISPEAALDTGGKSSITWWLGLAVFIGLLSFVAVKARSFSGYITSKQAFRVLFAAVLVHGILSFVVDTTVFVINKEKIDLKMTEVREETYSKMEEKGMTDEQIEQSMKWFDMFKPGMTLMVVGFFFRFGVNVLIALIIAQIVKRNPPIQPVSIQQQEE